MAQQVKRLSRKPGSLSSIPRAHLKVEGEDRSTQLPSDLYRQALAGLCCTHTHDDNNSNFKTCFKKTWS